MISKPISWYEPLAFVYFNALGALLSLHDISEASTSFAADLYANAGGVDAASRKPLPG